MPNIFNFNAKISKKSVIIVLGSIFFAFCLACAYYLSILLVKTDSSTDSVTQNSFEVYMLSLGKSQLESEAQTRASDFQSIGGGGFVWKQEDYYHIISSIYANKNDALLVQSSVKANQGLESEIISVNFKSLTLSGSFSQEEKKVLLKALGSFYEYYLNIYDIAISLDTLVYNEISARLSVNEVHNSLNVAIDNFNTLFSSPAGELARLSSALSSALQESQKLCSGTLENSTQTYSSLLKYRYTKVLKIYYDFLYQE